MAKVKVGIVGCGNISAIYFKAGETFEAFDIVACADLDLERAKQRAEEFNIPKACTVDELLADPEIDIVVNLTIPAAHAEIAVAALEAGKHVYGEKPLAVTREEGKRILDLAERNGLLVGMSAKPGRLRISPCRRVIHSSRRSIKRFLRFHAWAR